MGQEFRQGLLHELLTPPGVQGVTWQQAVGAGLLWKVQAASVTCLHLVGMSGRLGSARRLIHPIRLPGLHVAHSAEWSDFLHGGPGLCERKELETTDLQGPGPRLGTASRLPYSHGQSQSGFQKEDSVKESTAYFIHCTYYSVSTLRARSVPY